jgi:hypothetical protein
MADRMAASIEIGGKITKELLDELIALASDFWADDWSSGANEEYVMEAINNKKPLVLTDPEIAWGEFIDIEGFCEEHGLHFKRHTCPKYGYEGEIHYYVPKKGFQTIGATADGTIYLREHELREYHEQGWSLEMVLGVMDNFLTKIPSLELVEDTKTDIMREEAKNKKMEL